MHGSAHETVNKNSACGFVDFVFHGIGIHRNFDDDVELLGNFAAWGDVV